LDEAIDATPDEPRTSRRARAVVVGDDPAELRRLTSFLAPLPHQVVAVGSVGDALAAIRSDDDAAVVVIDARHPGVEALEVVRAIRGEEGAPTAPVLLLVGGAQDDPDAARELYGLGAVDVLAQPTDEHALRAKVSLLAELAITSAALRRADERADEHQRALAAQQSVMRALSGGASDDVISHVAQTLAQALGWQVGTFWATTGAGFRCNESWFDPSLSATELERLHAGSTLDSTGGVVGRAASSGVPVGARLDDLDDDDPFVRAALDAGLSDALALPIAVDSMPLGVIELLRAEARPLDTHTVATLDAIASLIAQFAQARRTEDETEALKNEFFALVSHELLTPLTSILGYLEELLAGASGEFNEEQEQDLEVIDRNARRLFRLVDDLMFVAQVETGSLSLNLMSVDLNAVVVEAIDAAQPAAKGRGIQLVAATEPVGQVRGDIRRLGQIVDHLISNAVKFSHDGGRVDVVLRRDGDDAVIEVADQGLGVPTAEQSRVFERFSRSSIAAEKEIPGIGLGLSISKVIAEAHGGSIAMDSTEGVGSTFSVTLPIERPSDDGASDHDQE
jgi:signal transduction histidine kinase